MAAGNERADELAKEGARDDSFQSILCDTYKEAVETCKAIIGYIGSFILQAKGGERWPDVVAPPQGWDEKDERWKRAEPILAHPNVLRYSGRQWICEVCDKRASGGAAKSQLARTECVGHLATALGHHARPQCHLLAQIGSYVCCCKCIRLLSSGWHPKENRYLGSPKLFTKQSWARWRQSYQGNNCDRTGLAELRQAVIRLRTADAQPTNPDDKKHLLFKTGEIKWCWKCEARVERDSAPRLLKTACSGAPRTQECERALSLLGKGQHPKSSVFVGLPSPISDEEWDQWHQDHGNLFFCLRELSSS